MSRMTKMTAVAVAAGLMGVGTATSAKAAEATVGLDIASAYVFRGVTFNDGPVAQPYVDIGGLVEGLEFGVWGNIDIDDYDGALEEGQFSEIDIWASYTLPLEGVEVALMYTEYTYPGFGDAVLVEDAAVATQGVADREIGVSAGLDLILAPYVAVYYGIDGGIEKSLYAEVGVGHDLELAEGVGLSLGALVGFLEPDEGDSGFHQYEVSASLSYGVMGLGLTYVGQIDDDVLTDDAYDVEVIGMLSLSHSF
jgi:hypothetical protein